MVVKQSVVTPLMEGIQAALVLSEANPDPQFVIDFKYREDVGVVMYYIIYMRPDICYCVQLLARFSSKVNRVATAGQTHLLQVCYNNRFRSCSWVGYELLFGLFLIATIQVISVHIFVIWHATCSYCLG
jgi:hypothetical protein